MFALRPLLLLLLPLCPGPGPGPGSEAKVTRSCAETRQVLGARGYSLNLIPPALISGEHLRVCPQEYTCCSSETEQRLIRETEATFRSLVEDSGSFLVHTLAARHRKFDEFFLEMLSVAQHSLTQLFSHSYGRLYAQHALIFNGLFSRLRDFYGESGEGLDDTLADFWAQLLERVFPLLHPQYSFPPDYLLCLSRLASSTDGSLQPFGDSPRRLRLQITRTLVAARAFVQGLETGRNVVSEALKVPLSEGCSQALMRLIGCPLCRGVPSLMPCQGFCLNVVRGCLSSRGLEPDWGNYLDGLLILADKLQGPFSFELAAESIGVKISEGLMYLQENSAKVSAQVFQECGPPHPVPARKMKAAALGHDLDGQDADEDASGSGGGQQYADDWMAGAVAPPARPPRPPYPPRRDGSGGKGGGGSARYNQGRSRSGGASIGFHTQTIFILSVSALALLGPR
ncbi:PREDICTED: glypican-2 [Mandrillus leucophaeus]|uniref:glypican-2 n=1 Tax=Mandrillus leucophaeus TaxID=9568 RepID=UPI0005F3A06C|nr:PREDICTED: glypican-2 [Mandrillus leucophaeus]